MKKNIKNKKGQTSKFLLLVGSIILIAFFVIIMFNPLKSIDSSGKNLGKISKDVVLDYDGDGLPNHLDPCPCGSPSNRKNEKENFDGVEWCILDTSACYENHPFAETKLNNREREICVYRKTSCDSFLERYYEDKKN